jgi:purine-binding chemotaxis protein CheW
MRVLLVSVGGHTCALPVAHVVETMRPLPVEPLRDMPPFVLGLSIIRGRPTPVVHLGRLVGAGDAPVARFLSLRLESRALCLAAQAVVGVRELDTEGLAALPSVLGEANGHIESVGRLDTGLVLVLRSMRILPESVWNRMHEAAARLSTGETTS